MAIRTDWIELWRQLVEAQSRVPHRSGEPKESHVATDRRWAKPDSTVNFIVAQLQALPGATLLDIGAGKGSWAVRLSPYVRRITALDASPAMLQAMQSTISAAGITNVDILQGAWPHIQVAPHDFALCSHSLYGSADLPVFIRALAQSTRRTCFLMLRAPTPDGIMAAAATRIWGHPYDSPNFQVCYNALLQLGIFANVLMADSGLWSPWKSASLEEALTQIKSRFGLSGDGEHDDFLTDLLRRRLTLENGEYIWPPGVRSALVYWNPNE